MVALKYLRGILLEASIYEAAFSWGVVFNHSATHLLQAALKDTQSHIIHFLHTSADALEWHRRP